MKNTLGTLGFMLLVACNVPNPKDRGYDTKEIAEEIRNKKIKKLTPTQINAWVYEQGGTLQELLRKSDFSEDIKDSLKKERKIKIELRCLSKKEVPKKYEGKTRQLIEASAYEIEQGKKLGTNLQQIENEDFVFIAPSEKTEKGIWLIYYYKKEVIKQIDTKKLH